MKTIPNLILGLLLAAAAACAPSPAPDPAPSVPEPAATHTPQPTSTPVTVLPAGPAATHTPRPTPTQVVVKGVGAVAATLKLPNQGGLFPAFGAGALWVPGRGLIARIDPATMEIVATITLDGGKTAPGPYAVTVEGSTIWATELASKALVRIDPGTNEIVDRIELDVEGELHAIALDGSAIWIAIRGADQVLKVDTLTRKIILSAPVDDPTSIAIGEGSVWVVEHHLGNLDRIDPNTGAIVSQIKLGRGTGSPGQVAFGEGGVWVGQIDGGRVSRVDPATNQEIAVIDLGLPVLSVEVSPGAVWAVVAPFDGCAGSGIVRIDPATNEALGKIPVRCAGDIAVAPDNVWVTSFQYREVTLVNLEE